MELSDRELALRWWKRKSLKEKDEFCSEISRKPETLTGREIEWIWRNQAHNK